MLKPVDRIERPSLWSERGYPVPPGTSVDPPRKTLSLIRRRAKIDQAENRDRMPGGPLEEERRAALAQDAVAQLGHLEARGYLHRDALQLAQPLQLGDEITQVRVVHL